MDIITHDQIRTLRWAIVVSVTMLFLAIPSGLWPYGYYVLLRWIVVGTGIFAAYLAYNLGKPVLVVILGLVVLLFNPIIPVHLDKDTWIVFDLFAALLYLVTLVFIKLPKTEDHIPTERE